MQAGQYHKNPARRYPGVIFQEGYTVIRIVDIMEYLFLSLCCYHTRPAGRL
jgi:hypothetical protein